MKCLRESTCLEQSKILRYKCDVLRQIKFSKMFRGELRLQTRLTDLTYLKSREPETENQQMRSAIPWSILNASTDTAGPG